MPTGKQRVQRGTRVASLPDGLPRGPQDKQKEMAMSQPISVGRLDAVEDVKDGKENTPGQHLGPANSDRLGMESQ
jgi:hypothetical protein